MRSCFYGKRDTASFLYRWNPTVMKVRNYDGESCLDLAAPHETLFADLESLEKERARRANEQHKEKFARPTTLKSSGGKKYRAASLDESRPNATSASAASATAAGKKHRSTSPAASPLVRTLRSASPSVRQPLSINVDMLQAVQTTTTGVLHPRGSMAPPISALPAKKLSKRSSFDSGINISQQCRKDAKTTPK